MFSRAVIFTAFNGFEKVTQTEKRRLAKVLNTLSKDINGTAHTTNESLDHVYRYEIFSTESPESMARYREMLDNLKAAAAKGINITVWVVDEKTYIENDSSIVKTLGAYREAGHAYLQHDF